MRPSPRIVSIALFLCASLPPALIALGAPPAGVGFRPNVIDVGQRIDANRISMVVTNTGSFAFDKLAGSAGLEWPKGSGKTAVFAAGMWLGASVGGQTRIAIAEYSDEYGPGGAAGGVPDDPNRPEYKVYKLLRTYPMAAARDAALADYNAGAVPHGAPPVTIQADGSLNITGDQMLWCVYNDLDAANHTSRAGSTLPLGVEVQQITFAFDRPGALQDAVFLDFKIINRGPSMLQDMYLGFWSDPDLGASPTTWWDATRRPIWASATTPPTTTTSTA